jgi:hypothetical protein
MPAAGTLLIVFPGLGSPTWLLPALVSVIGAGLLFMAWRLIRRSAPTPADDLVGAIAALDARYLGREGEVPAEEWQRYQSERARLKQRAELARGHTAS